MKKFTSIIIIVLICVSLFITSCGNGSGCRHQKIDTVGREANCYIEGLTQGVRCSICGEILKKQEPIPKTNHNYVEGVCTICNNPLPVTTLAFKEVNNGESYAVTGRGSFFGNVLVIPEEYNGKPVTEISDEAFLYNFDITKVVIPDTVKKIGAAAFAECQNLTTALICGDVEFKNGVFFGCKKLTRCEFFGKVTSIPELVFAYCTSIEEFEIPDDVTEIGYQAFYACSKLRNINLKNNIESIGESAFSGTDIRNIIIPYKVKTINPKTFENCKELEEITIGMGVVSIEEKAFAGCEELSCVIIPDNVRKIGTKVFYECDYLTEVDIGDGIEELPTHLFYKCPKLKKITLGKNVLYIQENIFAACPGIEEVHVENLERWLMFGDGGLYENSRNAKVYHNGELVKNK